MPFYYSRQVSVKKKDPISSKRHQALQSIINIPICGSCLCRYSERGKATYMGKGRLKGCKRRRPFLKDTSRIKGILGKSDFSARVGKEYEFKSLHEFEHRNVAPDKSKEKGLER